jgi:uncharacterized protein with PQ loop repeat
MLGLGLGQRWRTVGLSLSFVVLGILLTKSNFALASKHDLSAEDYSLVEEVDSYDIRGHPLDQVKAVEEEKWRTPFIGFVYQLTGWTAFLSWSFSFYPQIWENWKTYNVEGLSFDFVGFNFIKHSSYGIYNVVLHFSKSVQHQYEAHYHTTTIPVATNDVFFSIHAVAMVALQIVQLCTHDKGQQRITFTATMIISVAVLFILVNLSIALSGE